MTKYGLISLWNDENLIYKIENENPTQEKVKKYWLKHFYKTIHQVEEKEWLKDMKNKPKLRTYLTFKNKLKLEEYLLSEHNKKGRYLLTSLRVGTAKLRIETGRWKRPVEKESERICLKCQKGQIENEKHFIAYCETYDDMRQNMIMKVLEKSNGKYDFQNLSSEELWQVLMSTQDVVIYECVKDYVNQAMKKRNEL